MIVLLALVVGQPLPKLSAEEVERNALNARQQIRTLRLSAEQSRLTVRGGVRTVSRTRFQTWINGPQIRTDTVREWSAFAGFRTVDCLNCDKVGFGIETNDKPNMASEMFRLDSPGAPELNDAIDVRMLGYVLTELAVLRRSRLDEYLGSGGRAPAKVTVGRRDGIDCYVLSWVPADPTRAQFEWTAWIAPSLGWNVLRIELQNTKSKSVTSVSSEVEKALASDAWFPRQVVYEARTGAELETRETLTLSNVRINQDIPPETFTLKGINLRAGAFVMNRDDPRKTGRWEPDTEKVVRPQPPPGFFGSTPAVPVEQPGGGPNYWLLGACVACALGALYVVFARRRASA